MKKTNAIRLLEQAGIDYEARMYPVDESDLSGTQLPRCWGYRRVKCLKPWCCAELKPAISFAASRWIRKST